MSVNFKIEKSLDLDPLYRLDSYDYAFPEAQIALEPHSPRDGAGLWLMQKGRPGVEKRSFHELPDYLNEGDCLILNDVKVLPVRMQARRKGEGISEVLVTSLAKGQPLMPESGWIKPNSEAHLFEALISRGRKIRVGTILRLKDSFELEVLERSTSLPASEGEGLWLVRLRIVKGNAPRNIFEECGAMPLPPYIRKRLKNRQNLVDDFTQYQSVFAAKTGGGVAAPTAGLHFTSKLLEEIAAKKVNVAYLTLFISFGTFRPIRTEDIREHKMHEEFYHIPARTLELIRQAKVANKKVIAVGTTVARTLEAVASDHDLQKTAVDLTGATNLFIYPGFKFKVVDQLLTNFHQPQSSLLILACAFGGKEAILANYQTAIANGARLFSYGDATFIR